MWTTDPEKAPDTPETHELEIKEGKVVAVDGKTLSAFHVLDLLNQYGARNGVGRIDITENRLVGMKSRGCYETPGGTIIYAALRAIEQLVLDKSTFAYREKLAVDF